jgi:hypothetical protein
MGRELALADLIALDDVSRVELVPRRGRNRHEDVFSSAADCPSYCGVDTPTDQTPNDRNDLR